MTAKDTIKNEQNENLSVSDENENILTNAELLARLGQEPDRPQTSVSDELENQIVLKKSHLIDELSNAIIVADAPGDMGGERKRKHFSFHKKIGGFFSRRRTIFSNKISTRNIVLISAAVLLGISTLIYVLSFGQGKYEAVAEPAVYSQISKVSAEIMNFSVGVGQEVEKGDVLAYLDKNDPLFQLKELEFSLNKMEVSLKDSKLADSTTTTENSNLMVAEAKYNQAVNIANQAATDYANALTLFTEGVLPESELNNFSKISEKAYEAVDAAKAEFNAAKNSATTATLLIDIEKTKNEIEKLENSMKDYDIRATHDGKIVSILKVEGDVAEPGDHLLKIETTAEMSLVLPFTPELRNKVKFDQIVKFVYGDKIYSGKVKYLDEKKIKISIPTNCNIRQGQKSEVLF